MKPIPFSISFCFSDPYYILKYINGKLKIHELVLYL